MAENKDGVIVILSSPSGAGKTTLVKKISLRKNFKISISHTTRKPRLNEKNGRDYFFIDNKQFKLLIKKRKFLFKVKISKNNYIKMIKNRYISILLGLSFNEISRGIDELILFRFSFRSIENSSSV